MAIIEYPLSKGAFSQNPNKVIVHAMAEYLFHEGKWRHATEFLEMIGLSVHVLIAPNGDIYKCRDSMQGAYHAKGHNRNTLGVEWLVEGEHDYESFVMAIQAPYLTDKQFKGGCEYIRKEWVESLGILHHTRHSIVDPKRKVDPGRGFPWVDYLKQIGLIYRENN